MEKKQNQIFIADGHVYHSRKEGVSNSFRYPSFFLMFPVFQENDLRKIMKANFLKFLSMQNPDYLSGENLPLADGAKEFVKKHCNFEPTEVWLHTLPRMLGYVFNPVSFWICKKGGRTEAVLVEVRNTFGEKHFYWIRPENGIDSGQWYRAEKAFHVSPFFPVDGYYRFRFNIGPSQSRIDINLFGSDDKLRLATWIEGTYRNLDSYSVSKLFLKYGWLTVMVVVRIHSQAFRLWIRKQKFFTKPNPPSKEVSP